eukprot:NODE_5712_length_557_cov_30.031496_g4974_i0.p1 GENE.NODE_5712_length_557_cov_30.031496_g4974_i0~~NODE_5712_length_557_cov_30.031496_g4974_i0.p1  ORF type:complete len:181 (+),score=36.66 NODE_5712_length_557_cov_30.031496_g4974_i0:47-544(+)
MAMPWQLPSKRPYPIRPRNGRVLRLLFILRNLLSSSPTLLLLLHLSPDAVFLTGRTIPWTTMATMITISIPLLTPFRTDTSDPYLYPGVAMLLRHLLTWLATFLPRELLLQGCWAASVVSAMLAIVAWLVLVSRGYSGQPPTHPVMMILLHLNGFVCTLTVVHGL